MRDPPSPHSAAAPPAWSLFRPLKEIHEMKKIFAIVAAAVCLIQAASAQNFTLTNSNFTVTPLFSTPATSNGSNISAIGTDSAGNLYYLDTLDTTTPDTQLLMRTAASGYSAASQVSLYDYNTEVFGSFITVSGSTVYFGESSVGNIRSISTSGGSILNTVNVPDNYSFGLQGSSQFVDYTNSSFTSNQISLLSSNGTLTPVIKTGGASGPFTFLPNGNLIFGGSGSNDPGGIYLFTAAQISNALNTSTPLTLAQGTLLFSNAGNAYFAYTNSHSLYQAFTPISVTSPVQLTLYDPTSLTSQAIGYIGNDASDDDGDIFSSIAQVGSNSVAVAVTTNFGSGATTVYLVTQVPEPASSLLLAFGGVWLTSARGLRRKPRA